MQVRVLAFVLAGGKGTRLYPLTKERAKPAVPFGGRYRIVETRSHGHSVKLLLKEGSQVPQGSTFLTFDPSHTQLYENGWMAGVHR